MSEPHARLVVFAGPTLHGRALDRWPALTFAPPAAAGDVAAAAAQGAEAIAIIDGFFETARAVWHKEILWAIERGCAVFGASSMGALRAGELHTEGMIGVGRIFDDYRDLVHEDDDEVTLIHGPVEAGYMPLSEAMVNIRFGAEQAVAAGLLNAVEATSILAFAKALNYKDRNIDAIAEGAQPTSAAERFREFYTSGDYDLKARDAISLLNHLTAQFACASAANGESPSERVVVPGSRLPTPMTVQFKGLLAERGIAW